MRKNVENVFSSWWNARENKKNKTIHTNGQTIFSYRTPIIFRTADGILLDSTKYSKTTTSQQNSLRGLLTSKGFKRQEIKENKENKEYLEKWNIVN